MNWPKITPIVKLLGRGDFRARRLADHKPIERPLTDLRDSRPIGRKSYCDDCSGASSEDGQLTMFGDSPLAYG